MAGEKLPTKHTHNMVAMRFDFLPVVLADPASRNKRRPRLTTFDGAVLAALVASVNNERGYSYIGSEKIAGKLNATRQGVVKSVNKLADLEIIIEVGGGITGRARRWVPNWKLLIDTGDNAIAVATPDNAIGVDTHDNAIGVDAVTTAMALTDRYGCRTNRETTGTSPDTLARPGARAPSRRLSGGNKKSKNPALSFKSRNDE